MDLPEARAECERWLDYLARQEARTKALVQLADARRSGDVDENEARKRMNDLDRSPTVYDGSMLADAVRVLLKETS